MASMTENEIKEINDLVLDLGNQPNSKLVEIMDKLSLDFEETKSELINLTFYLDNIESLYNKILKEYQKRQV